MKLFCSKCKINVEIPPIKFVLKVYTPYYVFLWGASGACGDGQRDSNLRYLDPRTGFSNLRPQIWQIGTQSHPAHVELGLGGKANQAYLLHVVQQGRAEMATQACPVKTWLPNI